MFIWLKSEPKMSGCVKRLKLNIKVNT